jgi:hypothetical protein
MPFPVTIQTEVSALSAAITAATPLENASNLIITALSTQATTLVNDIDTALSAAAGNLDTFTAPTMAPAMVLTFLSAVDAAETQTSLCDLAGVAGRIASNLANG